jgi:hypothetical protein
MTLLNISRTENLHDEPADETVFEIMTDLNKQELRVEIKSPIIKKFFEGKATGEVAAPANWASLGSLYTVTELPRISGARFDSPGSPLVITDDGSVNLTALRAVNLDKGIVLVERGVPLTKGYVDMLSESFEAAFGILYREFLRPYKVGVSIRFESVA